MDSAIQAAPAAARRQPRARFAVLFLTLGLGFPCVAEVGEAEEEAAFEHPVLDLEAGRLMAESEGQAREIADATAYCVSCHDEEKPGAEPGTTPHGAARGLDDHPVDVPYPEGRNGYRPAAELDPKLLLLDGRVTCVTCHAHDDARHGTVLPTEQSRICTACHLT